MTKEEFENLLFCIGDVLEDFDCILEDAEIINNNPGVYTLHIRETRLYSNEVKSCKTCKYYIPYLTQFSNKPRGDGYCAIERMTPEGTTNINCNDDFYCSDYERFIEGGKQ